MAYYKNICFVEAPQAIVTPFPRFMSDCIGVCYLAGAVEDIVESMAMPENYYNERIFESFEQLLKSRPFDLAAISSMTGGFNNAVKLARIAKKYGVTVVMGGFHPTAMPEEARSPFFKDFRQLCDRCCGKAFDVCATAAFGFGVEVGERHEAFGTS